jgi:hypothetical protein
MFRDGLAQIAPADGTGSATRLTDSPNPQFATSITPDGTRVIIVETTPTQARTCGC